MTPGRPPVMLLRRRLVSGAALRPIPFRSSAILAVQEFLLEANAEWGRPSLKLLHDNWIA